jgi:hypothetical protein
MKPTIPAMATMIRGSMSAVTFCEVMSTSSS